MVDKSHTQLTCERSEKVSAFWTSACHKLIHRNIFDLWCVVSAGVGMCFGDFSRKEAKQHLGRGILFALLLFYSEGAPGTTEAPILSCDGPYSDLTFDDCQGTYFNTSGCYFLENFAQYRPCDDICNYVILDSLDDYKCQDYCPGKSKLRWQSSYSLGARLSPWSWICRCVLIHSLIQCLAYDETTTNPGTWMFNKKPAQPLQNLIDFLLVSCSVRSILQIGLSEGITVSLFSWCCCVYSQKLEKH